MVRHGWWRLVRKPCLMGISVWPLVCCSLACRHWFVGQLFLEIGHIGLLITLLRALVRGTVIGLRASACENRFLAHCFVGNRFIGHLLVGIVS